MAQPGTHHTLQQEEESSIVSFCSTAGFWVYFAMILLVPLLCLPPNIFLYATITSELIWIKDLGVRIGTALILVLAAIVFIGRGHDPLFKQKLIPWAIIAFLGFALLSVSFALNSFVSFQYLLMDSAFLILVFLAPFFITKPSHVKKIIVGGLSCATVIALINISSFLTQGDTLTFIYGANIYEAIIRGETQGIELQGGTERSLYFATFGNPEYTGTYLSAGLILVGGWLWGFSKSKSQKPITPFLIVGTVLLLTIFAGMILTNTRTSLVVAGIAFLIWLCLELKIRIIVPAGFTLLFIVVGLFGGFFVAVIFFVSGFIALICYSLINGSLITRFKELLPNQKVIISIMLALVLLGAVSSVAISPVRVRVVPIVERIQSGISTTDQSVRERLMFYLLAGEMFQESPLFGKGPGMYPSHFHSTLASVVEDDDSGVLSYNQILLKTWIAEQTHNDYFQIISEQGLLGIAAFLFIMVAVLQPLVRIAKYGSEEESALAKILVMVICGFLVMMITSFPLQESGRATTFFVLVSSAYGLIMIVRNKPESESAETNDGEQIQSA